MGDEELRALMRRFPSGVAVVTVDLEGERIGLTVSSLVALSLEPQLVGLAVSRQAALHELLRRAGAFGVSLLGEGQEELATRFSRGVPPIALWSGVAVREGRFAPLLVGALGWLECETRAEHAVGDHTLFVGEVVVAEGGTPARPLVHLGRAFVAV
jgi:3-hydroxy-9,10-secoandrosta-1,3,5(10)-triene-9,17-dione monooxygenase reductase component